MNKEKQEQNENEQDQKEQKEIELTVQPQNALIDLIKFEGENNIGINSKQFAKAPDSLARE